MALLWCDSFSHYATADVPKKYPVLRESTSTIYPTGGRRGGGSCYLGVAASLGGAVASKDEVFIGSACFLGSLTGGLMGCNGSANMGHVGIRTTALGAIEARKLGGQGFSFVWYTGYGSAIGRSADGVIGIGSWYYVEMYCKIHATDGVVVVRVNEVEVLRLENVDTLNTTGGQGATISQAGITGGATHCDFYVCDATGAVNNTFLGEVRVDCHFPTANPTHSDWTPSAAVDNHETVDEPAQNGDTDYNSTGTNDAMDTFEVEHLKNAGGLLHGVQVVVCDTKEDAGSCEVAHVARINSTDYVDATTHAPSAGSYIMFSKMYDKQPDDTNWNETDFNDFEVGYKKVS
jgi:hypothetical protein